MTESLTKDRYADLESDVALLDRANSSKSFLLLLVERSRFLGDLILQGLALGVVIAFLIPNEYESVTRLMPPDQQNSTLLATFAAKAGIPSLGGIANDVLSGKNNGALFIGILRSDNVADRLVDRFLLLQVYSKDIREDARNKLRKMTVIEEDRKSGIISLSVRDANQQRAAEMARAYVEELNKVSADLNTSAAHKERVFIEQRLSGVKSELDAAAKDLSEFSSKNIAFDIKEQGKAMVAGAASVQGALIAAKSELSGLEAIYSSDNVRVRTLQARINGLESELNKLGGVEQGTGHVIKNGAYPTFRELPLLGVQYAELYRRARIQETVFELLTQQYEMAKIQEAKELPAVRVLDEALVPEKKVGPFRVGIIAGCGLLTVLFGISFIYFCELWNRVDEDDPVRLLITQVRQKMQLK